MFDKIRRMLSGRQGGPGNDDADSMAAPLVAGNTPFTSPAGLPGKAGASQPQLPPVDDLGPWAAAQGYAMSSRERGGFALHGKVHGKPWRIERGRPSRDFIVGDELRARAELDLPDEVAVLLMNRALKDSLEKRAFSMYTDPLQTTVDPSLPEEMRWLAVYEEFGWESAGNDFWKQYALLADSRDRASAWLTPSLAKEWQVWPEAQMTSEIPMMFMVLRGKAYLRMQYTPASVRTLERATQIFLLSCDAAMAGLQTDLSF